MNYLKKVDKNDHTVVMVQVENETGVMGAAREHSPKPIIFSTRMFPQDFVEYLRSVSQGMMPEIRQSISLWLFKWYLVTDFGSEG